MSTQTILVTGSSSGFGDVIARTLLRAGHTVYATMRDLDGRNAGPAADLHHFAQGQSGTLHLLDLDVTSDASVEAAIESALRRSGTLDVVINNAGIGGGGYTEAFSTEQLQATFEVNVFGVQRVMRAVLPSMRARGSGLVINISSTMGRVVIPFAGAYTASKYAVEALTETYHYELAPTGVDVVLVEPGGFLTGYWSKLMAPDDAARVTSYGGRAEVPGALWAGFIDMLQSDQAPRLQVLADAVAQLIETPAGRRPLRTVVDPLTQGAAPAAINQVTEQVQGGLLQALGLGDLLSPAAPARAS